MDERINKFITRKRISDQDFGDIVLHKQLKEARKIYTKRFSLAKAGRFNKALLARWNCQRYVLYSVVRSNNVGTCNK